MNKLKSDAEKQLIWSLLIYLGNMFTRQYVEVPQRSVTSIPDCCFKKGLLTIIPTEKILKPIVVLIFRDYEDRFIDYDTEDDKKV